MSTVVEMGLFATLCSPSSKRLLKMMVTSNSSVASMVTSSTIPILIQGRGFVESRVSLFSVGGTKSREAVEGSVHKEIMKHCRY